MARSRREPPQPSDASSCTAAEAADLNFNEARTALELVLAELQASDLDVEAMAGLYQRGRVYAQRCETILAAVEQEVLLWDDLASPEASPVRYDADSDPL